MKNKPVTKEKIYNLYHNNGYTQEECAKKLKCSQAYISILMSKFNIKRREKFDIRHRQRISSTLMGHVSPKKGIPISDEQKNQIRETLKRKYDEGKLISWMKGKKHTEETKEIIKEKRKKQIITKQHKKKLSRAAIKNLEDFKFNGFRLLPTIGKHEQYILDDLEKCLNYPILRQYRVGRYIIDGYCAALNLAIEVDEKYHQKPEQLKKDKEREQSIIKNVGCKFLRLDVGDIYDK